MLAGRQTAPDKILLAAGACAPLAAVLAVVEPAVFWLALAALAGIGLAAVVLRFPVVFCVLWLIAIGSTAEMWLGEWLGDTSTSFTNWTWIIAAEKAAGFGLVAVCIFRFGLRPDLFNPGLAFAVMAVAGFARGLHPDLTPADSLRSLAGSVSLFAFCFSRLSLDWTGAVIRVCRLLPSGLVVAGIAMDAAGIRPLFVVDEGAWRMEATTHPAFLGGMAQTAIYAGLLEVFREGRPKEIGLMAVNLAILMLSGTRAPLLTGMAVVAAALLLIRSPAFGAAQKLPLLLLAGCAAPVVVGIAGQLKDLRLFNLLSSDATNLSNRDLIWPLFNDAWSASPIWGWGVGAGRVIMPATSAVSKLVGTTAAHNEYLRIGTEGGDVGLCLLIGLLAAWVIRHTRHMAPAERGLLRIIFLGFAGYCYTDNVLIASFVSVFFAWVTAVFARAAIESQHAGRVPPSVPPVPMTLFRAFAPLTAAVIAACAAGPAAASGIALVMNSSGSSISVVDMDKRVEVRRIPALREPHHWALSPDGRDLLVGDSAGNEVLFLDPATGDIRRRVPVADPYQLGFSPNGKWLVVNGIARNQVDVYDAATMKLVKRFPVRTMPSHLAYAPDSSVVYVSLQGSDHLVAIDLNRQAVLWDQPVGHTPAGVMWHDGKVLVANMGADDVAVVDPASGEVTRRIHVGRGAHQLFLSPDRKLIYVNSRVDGTTTALNAVTLAVARTYAIPGGPDCIDFGPDGKLWITRRWAEKVAVMDPATGQYQTVDVGRSPHGIFLNPKAN